MAGVCGLGLCAQTRRARSWRCGGDEGSTAEVFGEMFYEVHYFTTQHKVGEKWKVSVVKT